MKRFIHALAATGLIAISSFSYAQTVQTAMKPNASPANISPDERTKIESVVHDYLLKNPDILMQAIQVLQQRQYQDAEKTISQTQQKATSFANALFHQNNDPVAGNPNGKITVTEFFDYQCPHCVDMAPVIDGIIKSNPNVRFVFKEFPIRGPMSDFAARAALAANKQGKYYAFSHALLSSNQTLNQDVVYTIAKNAGLDVEKLKKDMNDTGVDSQLKSNLKLAQDLKLFGTPAFFVGKTDATGNVQYVPGQMDQKALQALIDKANKA